ncbi:MAG: phosphate ABC transporter permease PstA [Pseudomonadota bacterium]
MNEFRRWFSKGAPWIWLQAAAVSLALVMVFGLILLLATRGLSHFWPTPVEEWTVQQEGSPQVLVGQLHRSERVDAERLREAGADVPEEQRVVLRHLLKIGNRDLTGRDFTWVLDQDIIGRQRPESLLVIDRTQWGRFFGRLVGIREAGTLVPLAGNPWIELDNRLARVGDLRARIDELEGSALTSVNYRLERLRLEEVGLRRDGISNEDDPALVALEAKRATLQAEFDGYARELEGMFADIARDSLLLTAANGEEVEINMSVVLDAWRPNAMSRKERLAHYGNQLWGFISGPPREANTAGGVFPALFGTVLMVLLMSIFVTPLGVVAAVYLHEYAAQGWLTGFVRISVNNLAGVPSIVYGVFGLGFFIYFVGGGIDQLFFGDALPAPTFGTGGLFWASLTLALLTLPVVIVSTEEGLSRIPRSLREGSLALGATRWETLWRTVLPMASPGIMTGIILAVARAAGEVAPLMLVGVVKLAPTLPVDGDFPFLHLDRKFMHLGFHIYDVGFQSPNVEAARPLVYATALLLVLITLVLNLLAIGIRNRLSERYRSLEAQ